nr:hypothetical protein [Tanacetum cinerariifolium]
MSCGKDAHISYNCPSKFSVISNPEPCNNQTIDELPQTLPIFHPTFHSEAESPFTLDSTTTYVDESPNVFNPPSQPHVYPCEFCGNDAYYGHYCTPQAPFTYPEPYQIEDFSEFNEEFSSIDDDSFFIDDIDYVEASPFDSELVSSEVMEIVIPKVGGIDNDILLTIQDDILREKLLNINLLIAKIKALNDNPTPSFDFMTKSSSTSLNSLLEETNTCDNSLPEFETFCFDVEEISSDSTIYFSNSLLEEFTDELALITYPPDYDDNLQFDIESDLKEIEFMLYQDKDSSLKDSIDQTDLANLIIFWRRCRREGCNALSEKLPDLDSTKDLHPLFHYNPLSGSTTYFSNSWLKEFANELPPEYNDNLQFYIESDLKEIEFLLYQDKDPSIKDSIDQKGLANLVDIFVDPIPEMIFPGLMLCPQPTTRIRYLTQVSSFKKNLLKSSLVLAISNACLVLEDFDPPFYEPLFFKEVPKSNMLLPFSSENEEKIFKPGIHTFEKVKEYQEKDKIRSKPDKKEKRGEAEKSQKQLQ